MNHLWLRHETKEFEKRTTLVPEHAKLLIKQGYQVSVEHSNERVISDEIYAQAGCEIVPSDSWMDAPLDAYILGIKPFPVADFPIKHQHLYFAHVYKEQEGAEQVLERYRRGGGILYDLEYLTDFRGKQLVTSNAGYWAGKCGAAVTLLIWCQKQRNLKPPFKIPEFYSNEMKLLDRLTHEFTDCKKPSVLIIGSKGMTGTGVREMLKKMKISYTEWKKKDTKRPGPFKEILDFDILFNCILLEKGTSTFLTNELLENNQKLSLINDISCDPDNPYNPLPIYDKITNFASPTVRVGPPNAPVDIIAINNVTTFLPEETSYGFANQLFPYLCEFLIMSGNFVESPWERVLAEFRRRVPVT